MAVYLRDAHSPEAYRRMATRPNLPISPFSRAEFANATYRQVFLQRASAVDAKRAWKNFEFDCRSRLLPPVEFPDAAWNTIIDLGRRYGPTLGLRTLDSLHVACALELHAERFWTFDERQARLAEAAGLTTSA